MQRKERRNTPERLIQALFCPDDFDSAHYSPIFNFSPSHEPGFQICIVWERSIQILESFQVHDLNTSRVDCEHLASSLVDNGNFCVKVHRFDELPLLIVENADSHDPCLGGTVFSRLRFGNVQYVARFTVNNHVTSNTQASNVNWSGHTLTNMQSIQCISEQHPY